MRALALALALSFGPQPVVAASVEPPAAAEDELAEAKRLHNEAEAKYSTADYDGAVAAWQASFAALPRNPEANPYRSVIQYNIAAAYEKLYELRKDVEYLKKARMNLERFEASIDEIYAGAAEDGEQERANVKAKLAHIEGLLAKAETEPPPPKPSVDGPPPTDPKPTPPRSDGPPRARDGRGLVIGGGMAIGLGLIAGAGMTAALVVGKSANDIGGVAEDDLAERKEVFDRGRSANAAAIATGVIAAACVATGIALVVVGSKRKTSRTAKLGHALASVLAGRPLF